MNIIAVFAGQGAQKVGMGQDLYENHPAAKALFDQANEILGYQLSKIIFQGPAEELTKTAICQPALYVHGLACLAAYQEQSPEATIVATAGLSLGELTAHSAAGSFSFADGLKLVADRGRFMQEACEQTQGAMAAMIGGKEENVIALAAECDVDVANFNAPGQIVLSGSQEGIDKAVASCKEHGIKMGKALEVAGAYHSRLMKEAQEKLAARLSETEINSPAFPVLSNFTATAVSQPEEIAAALASQVTGSVRWTQCIQLLASEIAPNTRFLEFGPGGVLAGLAKRIDKSLEFVSIEGQESLDTALQATA